MAELNQPFFNDDEDDEEVTFKKSPPTIQAFIERKFLKERKVFFWGDTNEQRCRQACERLIFLEAMDPGKEITFLLNSPGGSITAGMALFDTMKMITSPIRVVVMGMAASMGSILLCAGEKGKRLLFPHSRVLIHQPLITGRMMGVAVDIHIQAQEMERIRKEMNRILSETSGQPMDKIERDTDRDFYMTAEEAIEYGLADAITDKID